MIVDILLAVYVVGVVSGALIAFQLLFGGGDGSATELFGMAVLAVALWPITIIYCWASFYVGGRGS